MTSSREPDTSIFSCAGRILAVDADHDDLRRPGILVASTSTSARCRSSAVRAIRTPIASGLSSDTTIADVLRLVGLLRPRGADREHDARGEQQSQLAGEPRRPSRCTRHDHRQSPSKMRDLAQAAGQQRVRATGLLEEIQGIEQGFGIRSDRVGERPDDPGVAALFLGVAQRDPHPPHERVPPEQGGHEQLEEPDEMIASPQVGQLVDDQRRSLPRIEPLPELLRDDQRGAAPRRTRSSARSGPGPTRGRRPAGAPSAGPSRRPSPARATTPRGASFSSRWKRPDPADRNDQHDQRSRPARSSRSNGRQSMRSRPRPAIRDRSAGRAAHDPSAQSVRPSARPETPRRELARSASRPRAVIATTSTSATSAARSPRAAAARAARGSAPRRSAA